MPRRQKKRAHANPASNNVHTTVHTGVAAVFASCQGAAACRLSGRLICRWLLALGTEPRRPDKAATHKAALRWVLSSKRLRRAEKKINHDRKRTRYVRVRLTYTREVHLSERLLAHSFKDVPAKKNHLPRRIHTWRQKPSSSPSIQEKRSSRTYPHSEHKKHCFTTNIRFHVFSARARLWLASKFLEKDRVKRKN